MPPKSASYYTSPNDPKRHSLSASEVIALVALIVTIIGSANAWLILPEQVKNTRATTEKLEVRVHAIEEAASERAETLARIDERTKRIEAVVLKDAQSNR